MSLTFSISEVRELVEAKQVGGGIGKVLGLAQIMNRKYLNAILNLGNKQRIGNTTSFSFKVPKKVQDFAIIFDNFPCRRMFDGIS